MKAYWGSGGIAPRIIHGGEWSALRPGPFAPRERAPGNRWIGGWVGPIAGLDAVVKRKFLSQSGAQRYTAELSRPFIL
jgi:hypothetical protein